MSYSIEDALKDLLLSSANEPLPNDLVCSDDMQFCYEYLRSLKSVISCFSNGDFSTEINIDGAIGSMLKDFQVKLNSTLDELRKATDTLKQEISFRVKVENALKKSHKRYQELALKDPLTGLNNRRHFHELAMVELKKMERSREGIISFGMMDIDLFKSVNDTYGHQAGDKCLAEVAVIMSNMMRDVDIIARYGGEEFVFMLPSTTAEVALVVAERIRKEIEEHTIEYDGKAFKTTACIGLADLTVEQLLEEEDLSRVLMRVLNKADSAMYAAKNRGKNCVLRFDE